MKLEEKKQRMKDIRKKIKQLAKERAELLEDQRYWRRALNELKDDKS